MADRLTIALVEKAQVSYERSQAHDTGVSYEIDYAARTALLLEAIYLTNLAILGCLAHEVEAQDVIRAAVPE